MKKTKQINLTQRMLSGIIVLSSIGSSTVTIYFIRPDILTTTYIVYAAVMTICGAALVLYKGYK